MLLVPVGSKRYETHGVNGLSDFNGLHSRQHDAEVQFYAFDILMRDGEDLRKLPRNPEAARSWPCGRGRR